MELKFVVLKNHLFHLEHYNIFKFEKVLMEIKVVYLSIVLSFLFKQNILMKTY